MRIKLIAVIITAVIMNTAASPALTVKMGSVAPDGSPWDRALKKIAVQWKEISGGTVEIKIYPGGIAGNESDMVRKIRIGQLQGAVFTGIGLSYISSEVMALSLPFFILNDNELDYVLGKSAAEFESIIEKKGFTLVGWSKAGWIRFFSNTPVSKPDEMKKKKLAVSDDDAVQLQAWREAGFNALPMSTNDIMSGLQSGMIDSFYAIPLAAASFQWFALAKNMCEFDVVPMIGGVVLSSRTWQKIPENIRPKLKEIVRKESEALFRESIVLEKKAVETMKVHGLKVNRVSATDRKEWEDIGISAHNAFIGKSFSAELYNKLSSYLQEHRKK